MKKLLLLVLLVSTLSFAQESEKTVVLRFNAPCGNQLQVAKVLNEFQEKPMIEMVSVRNNGTPVEYSTILFVNSKTQTFTIVEKLSDKMFCITVTGKDLNLWQGQR